METDAVMDNVKLAGSQKQYLFLRNLQVQVSSKEQRNELVLKCSRNANIFLATTTEKQRHARQVFVSLEAAVVFAFSPPSPPQK